MSHYIPAYTEINGRQQKTVCGVWVAAPEHSNQPTCRECAEWLTATAEEDEAIGRALEARFPEYAGRLAEQE